MGGFKDCVISLDNKWNTYYSGQTINGHVDLVLKSKKTIRGIFITIKGEAETNWRERKTRKEHHKRKRYTVYHKGSEEYFQSTYYLLGSSSGPRIDLPSGTHSYDFKYVLPQAIPSSFEGELGYVRYTIKVTVDRPWKYNHETKMAFTVISPLDLNADSTCRESLRMQIEKRFGCCCKSGPLSVDVSTPFSGYCSGQVMPIHIQCDNLSNVTVKKITAALRKIVIFTTQSPVTDTRTTKETVAKVKVGPVAKIAEAEYDASIEIPPLPPSNLVNCNIIDLKYELHVEVLVSGCNRSKLHCTRVIKLGTIPLFDHRAAQSSNQNPSSPSQSQVYPSSPGCPPPTQSDYPQTPEHYPPQPPPSYEVAMKEGSPQSVPPYSTHNTPYPPTDSQLFPQADGDSSFIGWNVNSAVPQSSGQNSQPSVVPVFKPSSFATHNIKDSADNDYTRVIGNKDFSPYYPTYAYNPDIIPPS